MLLLFLFLFEIQARAQVGVTPIQKEPPSLGIPPARTTDAAAQAKKNSALIYNETFPQLREFDNYFLGILKEDSVQDFFVNKRFNVDWWAIMSYRYFFNKVDYGTLNSLRVPKVEKKDFETEIGKLVTAAIVKNDEKSLKSLMSSYCKEQAEKYKTELAKIHQIKPDDFGFEIFCEIYDKALAHAKILDHSIFFVPNAYILDSFDSAAFELQKLKLPSLIKRVEVLEDINKSVEDLGKRVETAAAELKEIDKANKAMGKPISIFDKIGLGQVQPLVLEILAILLLISNVALLTKVFVNKQ